VGPARTLICKGAKAPTGSVCGGGATRSGVQTERKKKEAERKALEWGREDGNYREQGHNDPDSEQALGARAQRAARCRSSFNTEARRHTVPYSTYSMAARRRRLYYACRWLVLRRGSVNLLIRSGSGGCEDTWGVPLGSSMRHP
jgi:hypothetical protein